MADVGIVMPVYRQKSRYLKLALQSVLEQSYHHFHLVIVLDGATDKEATIIRGMIKGDKRVKIIKCAHNHGVASALNRGFKSLLQNHDIRYLTWVSSDNVYYPNFISTLRRQLRHAPRSVGLVYSSFFHIDELGHRVKFMFSVPEFRAWQHQPKENLLDNCFVGVSFMYRRKIAEQISGYRLEPVEDYDYWLRLTEHCDVQYLPKELMEYRVASAHSISRQLQNSVLQQQRWRYAYQLAKIEARQRRGIPCETTVIFLGKDGSEQTKARVEHLYEQYYSNFYTCVVDVTANEEASNLIKMIPDPRTGFVHFPGADAKSSIQTVVSSVATPFVYINTQPVELAQFDLFNMAKALREAPNGMTSAFIDANHAVQLSSEVRMIAPTVPALYRTAYLKG